MTRDYLPILHLVNFQLLHTILLKKLDFHFLENGEIHCQTSYEEALGLFSCVVIQGCQKVIFFSTGSSSGDNKEKAKLCSYI